LGICDFHLFVIYNSTYNIFYFFDANKQTIGKKQFGLKIVDKNMDNICYLKSFARLILLYISLILFVPIIISWIMMLVSKRKIALHDLLTGTEVIDKD